MSRNVVRPRVFFDISIDNIDAGRMVFELFSDLLPKTCANFYHLCVGDKGVGRDTHKLLHYKDCIFHRVVKGFIAQSGDFSHNTGIGGESIWGGQFEDEGFPKRHYQAGMLSMANSGINTNGSQFFITLTRTPSLDSKHVVFGYIKEGKALLERIEQVPTDRKDRPMGEVRITRCGDYSQLLKVEAAVIEEENRLQSEDLSAHAKETEKILADSKQITNATQPGIPKEKTPSSVGPDLSKMSPNERKFYELRQLFHAEARKTKREVMNEYKRLNGGKHNGAEREPTPKCLKSGERIVSLTAEDTQKIYERRRDKERRKESNGQSEDRAFTAYMRKISDMDRSELEIADEENLVDPNNIDVMKNVRETREDVQRLSNEIKDAQLCRRNFSRRRKYNEERDISFVNRRNEAFNAKVARAFDKYTYEIKANLERGTAI